MHNILNLLSAITAFGAAGFWFLSAIVELPSDLGIHDVIDFLFDSKKWEGNLIDGNKGAATGELVGQNTIIQKDMPIKIATLLSQLQKQSCWNKYAASCAGVSALCQFLVITFFP